MMSSFQPDAHLRCTCGYDLLRPAGNNDDTAVCTLCDWTAAGQWAEHSGTHHWIATRHPWTLTIRRNP